jgi:hypothetical protein
MSAKQENSRTFITALSQFGHAESSNLLPFIFLRLARNKLRDPYTINNFFLTKHKLSTFLKKHNLYLVAKQARRRDIKAKHGSNDREISI